MNVSYGRGVKRNALHGEEINMFFKPQWYKMLPDHFKPKNERILESIENLRKEYGLTHEMISMGIIMIPWAVRKLQEHFLEQNRKLIPNASEEELWKSVLFSRFQTILMALDIPPAPWHKPLSKKEILPMIENIDNICADFKSWYDVVEHIVSIDRDEGYFSNPSGVLDELNALLESSSNFV